MIKDTNGKKVGDHLYYDTCATTHVTGNKNLLHDYKELAKAEYVTGIENNDAKVLGIGALKFELEYNGKVTEIKCHDVKYVPCMQDTILSAGLLDNLGVIGDLRAKTLVATNDGRETILTKLKKRNGLFTIELKQNTDRVYKISTPEKRTLMDWHESFGHLNFKDTEAILKR
jgi:hypothetical protein